MRRIRWSFAVFLVAYALILGPAVRWSVVTRVVANSQQRGPGLPGGAMRALPIGAVVAGRQAAPA